MGRCVLRQSAPVRIALQSSQLDTHMHRFTAVIIRRVILRARSSFDFSAAASPHDARASSSFASSASKASKARPMEPKRFFIAAGGLLWYLVM